MSSISLALISLALISLALISLTLILLATGTHGTHPPNQPDSCLRTHMNPIHSTVISLALISLGVISLALISLGVILLALISLSTILLGFSFFLSRLHLIQLCQGVCVYPGIWSRQV